MPSAPYSYVTRATMRQELSNRLYNPATGGFWDTTTGGELDEYINEALRTWNALTSYWRDDFIFTPTTGSTWYDIPTLPNTLRPYAYSDVNIYDSMEWSLLEPAVGINPWSGSTQFSADDFLNAVQRRRDEILSTTGCTVTRSTVPAVSGRIILPDNVFDIRRLAYLPAIGSPSVLWPEDTWGEMSYEPLYVQNPAGTPVTYLQSTQSPISFDTNCPPGSAGSYELLTINSGPAMSVSTPSALNIPDDWAHVVKWGALADLLSRESNAKDAVRAQYCEGRYRMGLKLLSEATALLAIRVNNVPVQIDSIRSADLYATSWQALSSAVPAAAYYAGLNLFALSPAPDAGPYSVTVTVVENAPISNVDTSKVQMARDDYDAILDYAQHIASFKQGGEEFLVTMPLFQRFMKQAAIYSSKLDELGEFTKPLYGLAQLESNMNPRMAPVEGGE